jgi:hypothetical protein
VISQRSSALEQVSKCLVRLIKQPATQIHIIDNYELVLRLQIMRGDGPRNTRGNNSKEKLSMKL